MRAKKKVHSPRGKAATAQQFLSVAGADRGYQRVNLKHVQYSVLHFMPDGTQGQQNSNILIEIDTYMSQHTIFDG
jgi:hypothetical protein